MNVLLAEQLNNGQIQWLTVGFGALVILAVGANAILGAIKNWKIVFGRKPPFDEEMSRHNATIEKIKDDLANLAPNEKLEALIEKLGSFATLTQLAEVRLNAEQQAKETRVYAHAEVHGLREEINARLILADNAREGIHERLGTFAEVLFELRGKMDLLIQLKPEKAR